MPMRHRGVEVSDRMPAPEMAVIMRVPVTFSAETNISKFRFNAHDVR